MSRVAPPCAVRPGLTLVWDTDAAAVLGRSPTSDLCLPDPTASRQHARQLVCDGRDVVEGLTPGNGLFVAGRSVDAGARAALVPGDSLQVGGVVLEAQILAATAPVVQPLGPEGGGPAPVGVTPIRLDVTWDADHCGVAIEGQLLALPPLAAKALGMVAENAGQVVHRWDLVDHLGRGTNLAQVFSVVRSAFLTAVEQGTISLASIRAHVRQHNAATQVAELDALDPRSVLRHFVAARRGHGYRICLSADEVTVRRR